ncbi:hypothetical protein CMK11_00490 [Candidatus Poribacteria bacterium]|nr:hypothetical protein [Candidatus Poribacteria bacterium]
MAGRTSRAATLGAAMMASCILAWAGGSTTVHRIESAAVAGNMMGLTNLRPLSVYTPEGYEDTRRLYPVIYWIPGWKTPASREYVGPMDAAIDKGWVPPVIVVSVDVREGVLMLNSPVFGNWADFLIDEVVPFIDGEYRTIASAKGRALMGHSTGGYAAMLLPLLHPGVWSAVGLNDASVWGACDTAWEPKVIDEFSEYPYLTGPEQAWTQVAIATAPNMASPRFFDHPTRDGYDQAVQAAWRSRCLQSAGMLRDRRPALAQIAVVGLTLPKNGGNTNRGHNLNMVKAMLRVGVVPQVLNVRGTHGSHRQERFVFLAGLVTSVMSGPAFDTADSRASTWASLKGAAQPDAAANGAAR